MAYRGQAQWTPKLGAELDQLKAALGLTQAQTEQTEVGTARTRAMMSGDILQQGATLDYTRAQTKNTDSTRERRDALRPGEVGAQITADAEAQARIRNTDSTITRRDALRPGEVGAQITADAEAEARIRNTDSTITRRDALRPGEVGAQITADAEAEARIRNTDSTITRRDALRPGEVGAQITADAEAEARIRNTDSTITRRDALRPGEVGAQITADAEAQARIRNTDSTITRRDALVGGEGDQQAATLEYTQAQTDKLGRENYILGEEYERQQEARQAMEMLIQKITLSQPQSNEEILAAFSEYGPQAHRDGASRAQINELRGQMTDGEWSPGTYQHARTGDTRHFATSVNPAGQIYRYDAADGQEKLLDPNWIPIGGAGGKGGGKGGGLPFSNNQATRTLDHLAQSDDAFDAVYGRFHDSIVRNEKSKLAQGRQGLEVLNDYFRGPAEGRREQIIPAVALFAGIKNISGGGGIGSSTTLAERIEKEEGAIGEKQLRSLLRVVTGTPTEGFTKAFQGEIVNMLLGAYRVEAKKERQEADRVIKQGAKSDAIIEAYPDLDQKGREAVIHAMMIEANLMPHSKTYAAFREMHPLSGEGGEAADKRRSNMQAAIDKARDLLGDAPNGFTVTADETNEEKLRGDYIVLAVGGERFWHRVDRAPDGSWSAIEPAPFARYDPENPNPLADILPGVLDAPQDDAGGGGRAPIN